MADHAAKPLLTNKLYDTLKFLVQVILPGLGTLYFTLAQIWGLPYAEQIVGTLAALAVFGGLLLGLSKRTYGDSADGVMVVDTSNPEKDVFRLELNSPPEELAAKKMILFRVES